MAGLKKRRLMPCSSKKTTSTTKKEKHTILEKPSRCPSPPHSGDSSDEDSQELPSTTDAYTKPSDLDKLLNLLGSGKESLASIYKTRKRQQEGKSDSEEDSAASESSDASDEEMDSRGDDSGYNQSEDESEQQLGSAEKSEESDAEYMETFDTDSDVDHEEAGDLKDSITESKSNFHSHLQRVLTKADFDDLLKRTWKDSWEIPPFGLSTSKWRGMGEPFMQDVGGDPCIGLKVKLYNHWNELYKNSGGADFTASRERHFYLLCNSYRDILYCNKKPFYQKGVDEDSSIMDAYIMHTLNHIYRTRNLVVKNDNKLTKNEDRNEDMIHGGGFLDRGFTRPKVLLLLPFRSIALRVVKRLLQLTPHTNKTNVEYLDRFYKEFGTTNDEENLEAKSKSQKTAKPADHQVLFGGNISEEFMFGIKFTRGSIKLYSDFYSSDIIVASPVQLVHAIGIAETEKDKDVDYLSSIEILIMDHVDIIAIQNWSHINSIFEKLNIIPTDHHGTDIMRVRPWYLDGQARFYRQTIILGSYLNPDINAVFNHCDNYEGKIKFLCEQKGVLGKVMLPVRQVFERFDPPSIVDADDSRFDYFTKKVFPKFKDSVQGGIMIFISSYFDYVRLRNFLKSQNASFCLLGEYTKQSDISRARVWFFEGKRKIMLYTERAHFYHRYKIRGLQNLIIYSLPERKEFYPEIVNMLDEANNMSCTALFSRFDNLQLERIVGSGSSKRMMSSDKEIFAFA